MSADVDFVKIGKRIRNARKKCQMTQDEVARACNVTNNHISGVETGTQHPSLELFIKLGSVLGCGLDYFIADTLYAGKTYLIHQELAQKLESCSARELQLIENMIDEIILYREDLMAKN